MNPTPCDNTPRSAAGVWGNWPTQADLGRLHGDSKLLPFRGV